MNSDFIFRLIEKIAALPGKNDKLAIISAGAQSEDFKRVLEYSYSPFKVFGIANVPTRRTDLAGVEQFDAGTWQLLDDLIARKITGNEARDAVAVEMGTLTEESAELLKRIIKKDLRAGFSESTINKAVKGLIKEFPYQRCCLPKDANLEAFPWAEGVISQEKADGLFANVDYEESGSVSIRSRQGSEFPTEPFTKLIAEMKVRLLPGYQHHGEILVRKAGEIMPRALGNGVMNSVLKGGDFADDEEPIYLAWDAIPLSKVVPKGKYDVPYLKRIKHLFGNLSKPYDGDSVALIPTRMVHSLTDAYAHAGQLMKKGKEGTVIKDPYAPWVDGTSRYCVKIKVDADCELKVVGFNKGEGKNASTFGSMICRSECGLLEVGVSGMSDVARKDYWLRKDELIGSVVTVKANAIMRPTKDDGMYSLFLPRLVELRADKSTADDLAKITAQFAAAIGG